MAFGDLFTSGTASATNGSKTVDFSGVLAASLFLAGDTFDQGGRQVTIEEVVSNDEVTLVYPWPGSTTTNAAYAVRADSGKRHDPTEMTSRVRDLLEKLEVFAFARPIIAVLAITNAPDGGAVVGDRFLVGPTPSGAFADHANEVAEKTETSYRFWIPDTGWNVIEGVAGFQYAFDGEIWKRVSGPVEFSVQISGKPAVGEVLIDRETSEPFTVQAGAPGWILRAVEVPPLVDADFSIMKDDDEVGTATIPAGETHAEFVFDDVVTWDTGDRFKLVAPTPRDANMTGLDFTAVANR